MFFDLLVTGTNALSARLKLVLKDLYNVFYSILFLINTFFHPIMVTDT